MAGPRGPAQPWARPVSASVWVSTDFPGTLRERRVMVRPMVM